MFYEKYLKYKMKYHQLKQKGGLKPNPIEQPPVYKKRYDIKYHPNESNSNEVLFTADNGKTLYQLYVDDNYSKSSKMKPNEKPILMSETFSFRVLIKSGPAQESSGPAQESLSMDFNKFYNHDVLINEKTLLSKFMQSLENATDKEETERIMFKEATEERMLMKERLEIFSIISHILIFEVLMYNTSEKRSTIYGNLKNNVNLYNEILKKIFPLKYKNTNFKSLQHENDDDALLLYITSGPVNIDNYKTMVGIVNELAFYLNSQHEREIERERNLESFRRSLPNIFKS